MRRAVINLASAMAAAGVLLLAGCSRGNSAPPDFADLVEQVSPAVVNISAVPSNPEPVEEADEDTPDNKMPEWLRKFLQQRGGASGGDSAGGDVPDDKDSPVAPGDAPNPDTAPGGDDAQQSLGSGFILSADGYILTNQHVVKDSKEVVVRLSDRRQFAATVVGSDERSDLALLKIDATGLPAVKIADMSKIRVGEWVLAIGSPFGFDYSVTAGIISAKGRNLDTEQYVPFIQTDAAINPGNSGGPLFNLKGEVVGVNSQIYSQTGGFMGVAFSIPIDVAAKVAKDLKEKGKVTRGWLGVSVQPIDRNLAKSFKLDRLGGALVARVIPDGPAQQAGIRAGDVILRYNGIELASDADLVPLVGASTPGDSATLILQRDGKQVMMKVEVGSLDSQDQQDGSDADANGPAKATPGPNPDAAPPARTATEGGKPLGLTVRPLSDDERKSAKIVSGGVRVTAVAVGTARDAGVIPGDIILSISGQDVDGMDRYDEAIGRLTPGQTFPILVQRDGTPKFLAVQVPPKP